MNSIQKNQKINRYLKLSATVILSAAFFYAGSVFASAGEGHLGDVAANVTKTFGNIARLTTSGLYVVGMIFALISLLQFKAHKDNPQSTPLSKPLTFLFLAAAMLFTPTLFGVGGKTLFGSKGVTGSVSGFETFTP